MTILHKLGMSSGDKCLSLLDCMPPVQAPVAGISCSVPVVPYLVSDMVIDDCGAKDPIEASKAMSQVLVLHDLPLESGPPSSLRIQHTDLSDGPHQCPRHNWET